MLYLTCTMISSVDLAHNGVSHVKDWCLRIVVQVFKSLYFPNRLMDLVHFWYGDRYRSNVSLSKILSSPIGHIRRKFSSLGQKTWSRSLGRKKTCAL